MIECMMIKKKCPLKWMTLTNALFPTMILHFRLHNLSLSENVNVHHGAKIMLDRFLSYIHTENLIPKEEKVLLAVSGGMDSMAMVDLFLNSSDYYIEIAHVNHHLRGDESDADSEFVSLFCQQNGIQYHQLDIDPSVFKKGNLQETARKIRYEWLNELAQKRHLGLIATAHHCDDVIETAMMNLMRGTGLEGMKGIANRSGIIIRPLLFATKTEIETYANHRHLAYREDSSNLTDKYMRNKVRHHVLPAIYQADQRARQGMMLSIENMNNTHLLLDFLMAQFAKNWITEQNGETTIALEPIIHLEVAKPLLYEILNKYGFNFVQCSLMVDQSDHTGLTFQSTDYECITNRQELILRKRKAKQSAFQITVDELPFIFEYEGMCYNIQKCQKPTSFANLNDVLYLDEKSIYHPITIRLRNDGDKIKALGMGGKTQKVKDILTNKKLSAFEKEKVLILEDASSIKAILMVGIADDVKITESTESCIAVTAKSIP